MTVCSGIGAPEVSAPWIDWRYQSEIEKFPCAVLAHRFPDAVNLGDMTRYKEWPDATVDVLCGGTPCQSFSVAGLRKGLDDPRGNLMLTYLAIAGRYRPRWVVWENVPGVLSSSGGRDFGSFLGGLGQLGYGFAYRVLDAQYVRTQRYPWAVPQRRRRVFVVGYLGDWRPAAAVLFDAESLRRDPPPRREAGQGVAPTISARPTGGGGLGTDFDCDGGLILSHDPAVTLTARDYKGPLPEADLSTVVAHSLRGEGFDASEDGTGRGTPLVPVQVAPTLRAGGNQTGGHRPPGTDVDTCETLVPVAFDLNQITSKTNRSKPDPAVHHTLPATSCPPHLVLPNNMDLRNADAYEADASSALSTLRHAVGAEAYAKWGLGVLAAFRSPEVLRAWLHGGSLQGPTEENRPRLDDGALSRPEGGAAAQALRTLWEEGPNGRSPQGRGLAKQLAGKPRAALSVLPHEGASAEVEVQFVRAAREGARLLRKALSEMEEVGRSAGGKDQPEHAGYAVRRLTPKEAERLQGFPDNWTAIPWRGKPADKCPDGPRYKALGNSWAVNCGEFIFERIKAVEAMT